METLFPSFQDSFDFLSQPHKKQKVYKVPPDVTERIRCMKVTIDMHDHIFYGGEKRLIEHLKATCCGEPTWIVAHQTGHFLTKCIKVHLYNNMAVVVVDCPCSVICWQVWVGGKASQAMFDASVQFICMIKVTVLLSIYHINVLIPVTLANDEYSILWISSGSTSCLLMSIHILFVVKNITCNQVMPAEHTAQVLVTKVSICFTSFAQSPACAGECIVIRSDHLLISLIAVKVSK